MLKRIDWSRVTLKKYREIHALSRWRFYLLQISMFVLITSTLIMYDGGNWDLSLYAPSVVANICPYLALYVINREFVLRMQALPKKPEVMPY